MKRIALVASLFIALICSATAGWQSRDSNYNHSIVSSGGPASFTFGGNIGSSSPQSSSPYMVTGTFNTGASDLVVVEFLQEGDTHTGTISSVSVASTPLTCQTGINNSAGEKVWMCYGSVGAQTTATISIAFTGTSILVYTGTGKLVTTTPTPSGSSLSTIAQGGGIAVPFNFGCMVPTNGVSVGILGNFFAGSNTFTSVSPNQDAIINDSTSNGQDTAMGHTTASGTAGITVAGSAPIFPAWAAVCWSP